MNTLETDLYTYVQKKNATYANIFHSITSSVLSFVLCASVTFNATKADYICLFQTLFEMSDMNQNISNRRRRGQSMSAVQNPYSEEVSISSSQNSSIFVLLF